MTTLHLTDNEVGIIVNLLEEREADLTHKFRRIIEDRFARPEAADHYADKLLAIEVLLNQITEAQIAEARS